MLRLLRRLIIFIVTSIAFLPLSAQTSKRFEKTEEQELRAPQKVQTYLAELELQIDFPEDSQLPSVLKADTVQQAKQVIRDVVSEVAEEVHSRFHLPPPKELTITFLSTEDFSAQTRAPRWTTGVLLRPTLVVIPENQLALQRDELLKTIRHEYLHAAVAAISDSRSPAWLDEGLAQLIEGSSVDGKLTASFHRFLRQNECLSLAELNAGFSRFRTSTIPFAYGYSLFATNALLDKVDTSRVATFLSSLKKGLTVEDAFERMFHMPFEEFENSLRDNVGCERDR